MLTSICCFDFGEITECFGVFSPLPEKSPVEAKLPWFKQAHEMEETVTVSEEPT